MAVIGIDLGTTNSLASVWRGDTCELIPNALGELLTPSVVSVGDDGQILTGQIAKERLVSHPSRTAASFKRFMGTDRQFDLGGMQFHAEDLSSFILKQLKADAEVFLKEQVTEAVISVPAYFNDDQRNATKLAGELAGLTVQRIINEPSAAALVYQTGSQADNTFLVFDFGGGTLDVSVVESFENIIEILAVAGDNQLGGDDIDAAILEYFLKEYPDLAGRLSPSALGSLYRIAAQCKMTLSSSDTACMVYQDEQGVYSLDLDNKKLLEITALLLARMEEIVKRSLKDARRTLREIDQVILVGGSSKMPLIRSYLKHLTGKTPLCSVDPDKTVAMGAGMVAGIKERKEGLRDLVLTDICPFTLGVAVRNSADGDRPILSPVIERNCALPCSREKSFFTCDDDQTEVRIQVFQGESYYVSDNLKLGELVIGVPAAPAGEIPIFVRFSYDLNGILEVEVRVEKSGEIKNKVFVNEHMNLSEDEVAKRLEWLRKFKMSPETMDCNQLLMARGQRLFSENTGGVRRRIFDQLSSFCEALYSSDPIRIQKSFRQTARFFDAVEQADSEYYGIEYEEDV